MSQSENEVLLFSNEKAIYRISLTAKIVSWIILVLYVFSFGNSIYSTTSNPTFQFPKQFLDMVNMFVYFLQPLTLGLFFFLTLQGIANGLYLGLDLIYEFSPEDE